MTDGEAPPAISAGDMEAFVAYQRTGSMKEAARDLGIGLPTCKRRLARVRAALGVDSSIQAAYLLHVRGHSGTLAP